MMRSRILLFIVLFFVLGGGIVSSIDSLNYTFKSAFYIIAMVVLIVIGLAYIFKKVKEEKDEQ